MRNNLLLLPIIFLSACGHSDPFPTGPTAALAPLDSLFINRITYGTPINEGHQWTLDGSGILYDYIDPTLTIGGQCFGIIPRMGGSRSWKYCDTRGSNADSIVHYSNGALSAGGQFVFMEAVYRVPPPNTPLGSPVTTSIWLTDTANPAGHRRLIARLPKVIGDSVVSWIAEPGWIDETHFVFVGERYSSNGVGLEVPEPKELVLGTVTAPDVTLQQINGTLRAAHWTRASNGDLLFLRGQWWDYQPPPPAKGFRGLMMDSLILKIPLAGGTAVPVAITPRRLHSFSCSVGACLATDGDDNCTIAICNRPDSHTIVCTASCSLQAQRFFYFVDPLTFAFTIIPTIGNPYVLPVTPRLSPDGTEFAYLHGSLYRSALIRP